MTDHGIKVSKFTYDVRSAKLWKMLANSGFPLLKLAMTGNGNLEKNASSSGVTVEITHNLGYVPICYVFGKYLDFNGDVSTRYKEFSVFEYAALQDYNIHYYYADTTKLYIVHGCASIYEASDYDLPYYYMIFHDEEV